ncbi:hypothetical protein [uncultured Winogradskyella sp.]|uniref:hypothetical protein n=1 Tax=uncultured Winogradskyella sp. TaxID=395353 RepID=UPI0030DB9916|tara:strand:- start:17317 stop:18258 length:942 start_codon:yes stop_codon:yes gene_type:complete
MKKLVLILLTLSLFTACENEPLDPDFTEQGGGNNGGNNGGGNQNGGTFAMSSYTYNKAIDTGVGVSTIDTDFSINSSGQISSQNTRFEFFGAIIDGTAPVVRDGSGRVIETSVSDGSGLLSTTSIVYNGDNIVQINFVDTQFSEENYTYNIEHNGNISTRTEVGSTESIIYTFDNEDKLIERETLNNGNSIRIENHSYDSNNNLISSVMTGDGARTFTYTFDDTTNPVNSLFQDFYKYQLFNDNYDDQFEHWLVIWGSTNNMVSATTPEGPSDLAITYDSEDRIITRNGSINSALLNAGSGGITTEEIFTYVN